MKIDDILSKTEHRPWKVPAGGWKFYQEWNNAIFLHYQVELEDLKQYVPKELQIDLFEGKGWISIVAFTMDKIRPKNLPSFSPISNFDEINIRTYVKSNNKTGVYFLSIEGAKKKSCKVAKVMSELPYRYSKILRNENKFESLNSQFDDSLKIDFVIGNVIKCKSELDIWLTERYALFQDTETAINEFEIHHLEWEINELKLISSEVDYKKFNSVLSTMPSLVHYSKGVQVVAWGKVTKKKLEYVTLENQRS